MKYIVLAFVLSACGPTWMLQRADKLTKKAIALGAKVQADTIYTTVHDTIRVAGTSRNVKESADTVYVHVDRDSVRVVTRHDTIHHTKRLEITGPTITRTIRVPYAVTKTISCPPSDKVAPWYRTGFFICGGLLLLLLLFLVLRK